MRRACWLLLFLGVSGCGPSQTDVENSIRDGMKSQLNVEVASINITKQENGSYLGTVTAKNGDVYDVSTDPPSKGKLQWTALPSLPVVERQVREAMGAQLKMNIKTLSLTKQDAKKFEGKAEAATGQKWAVSVQFEGLQMKWNAIPILN